MHIAVDLDGTIDAAPSVFQSLLATLKASGSIVTVITADVVPEGQTTDDLAASKKQFLANLGLGTAYSQLVVIPQPPKDSSKPNVADAKAAWLANNHVDLFIDNNKDNAKAGTAAGVKLVLVPWATRV